ncbi:response regulator [Algoriphagus pacificus]|uniref:Response regulator n=1 Tax=Algoriphagus pacificus TaxID=2811234 RepID=A0ABS3CIU7_9BACT|nr:response regulator [Algoriphagus pacificus]MBN7816977.1 response regulator [Algoriphagus pacificus]
MVFIIDDDKTTVFLHKILVKSQLVSEGIQTFFDPKAALESIVSLDSEGQKILIFLDINMPEMNGWDFLDELQMRVNLLDIKVIILTSSLSKTDKDKCSEYPMVIDYWEKPMGVDHLIQLKKQLGDWFS